MEISLASSLLPEEHCEKKRLPGERLPFFRPSRGRSAALERAVLATKKAGQAKAISKIVAIRFISHPYNRLKAY
jgi:hypothetical protein